MTINLQCKVVSEELKKHQIPIGLVRGITEFASD